MQLFIVMALVILNQGEGFNAKCAKLIGDRGGVAVMDLRSGQLVAATNPDLLFAQRYPPGSVAKLVTAMLAVEKGLELPHDFLCDGYGVIDGDTLWCSMRSGHGEVGFEKALVHSCNLYFQKLTEDMGADELVGAWQDLGLDRTVGVDLPGEVASIITYPATDSAKLAFAIGQGRSIQLTPVAMLALVSGIATRGELLRPRIAPGRTQVLSTLPSEEALAAIYPLMREVVRKGTGKKAELEGIPVAGKTGSSTVLGNWVTHGWFVGFAPFSQPRIALVVFLHRGEGSDAAQIAGKVVSAYFGGGYVGD